MTYCSDTHQTKQLSVTMTLFHKRTSAPRRGKKHTVRKKNKNGARCTPKRGAAGAPYLTCTFTSGALHTKTGRIGRGLRGAVRPYIGAQRPDHPKQNTIHHRKTKNNGTKTLQKMRGANTQSPLLFTMQSPHRKGAHPRQGQTGRVRRWVAIPVTTTKATMDSTTRLLLPRFHP